MNLNESIFTSIDIILLYL